MIAKGLTTTVNFYAMNTDGTPAVGKAITATISINGASATSITDTITEVGSGWYKFNHLFNTEGNAFVQFSCTDCVIPPWEDNVVDITTTPPPTATEVAYAVWEENVNRHTSSTSAPLYYLKFYIDRIPQNVWGYSGDRRVYLEQTAISSIWNNSQRTLTSSFPTARDIWNYGSRILTSPVTYNDTDGIIFLATADNVATAVSDLETYGDSHWLTATGFSTFNPSTDDVNVSSISISSIQSGLATSSDITTSEAAIIAAIPAVPTDYAKAGDTMALSSTDINSIRNGLATETEISNAQAAVINAMPDVSGLSTFDAATDRVIIDAAQAATMETATGFATPNDIPTDDITAIKNKVDTLENTDLTGIATVSDISNAQSTIIEAIPVDYATSSDLTSIEALIKQLDAGVLHWATTATRLTLYNEDNTVQRVYALERDIDGNITRIGPINA